MQRTILFVDDNDILYRSGTKRILSQPKRHQSNPLIKTDRPWEVAIGWTSIYRDPETGKYQLWYQAFAGDQAEQKTHRCVVCYAISDDGIHFSKPDLDQFAFNDIEHTNIVLVGNGGHSLRYANSVIYDPKETEPQKRYKMAYFDFSKNNGLETPGLCVAFSPDGINWTKHPQAPLLKVSYGDYGTPVPLADHEPEATNNRSWDVPLSMSDAVDVLYDPKGDLFVIYGKMWIDAPDGGMYWKHGMGRTTSKNFIDWSKPELLCVPDEFDPPHLEFHTTPVFFYQDVYFCLNQILNRAEGGGVIDIELGISRDGIDWRRPFRESFFIPRPGAETENRTGQVEKDQFDSGSIFTNSTPVFLEDEIRFYYGGYSKGATGADDYTHVSGVGMVTLPRDRFAGITPVAVSNQSTLKSPLQNVGQMTLKPISLSNVTQILLNADASAGEIRVELLDLSGRRVQGFTREESYTITGDSLVHQVKWTESRLSDLDSDAYLLRLHLYSATVYALTLVSAEE